MHLILLLIAGADMLWKRIPDELSLLLLFHFISKDPFGLPRGALGFLLFGALYYVSLYIYSKEVLGFGDVKLFSVLFIGLKNSHMNFVFFSFLSAGIFSLILLFMGKNKDYSFPFAPFIILSFIYYY